MKQNNLGNTLWRLGERVGRPAGGGRRANLAGFNACSHRIFKMAEWPTARMDAIDMFEKGCAAKPGAIFHPGRCCGVLRHSCLIWSKEAAQGNRISKERQ